MNGDGVHPVTQGPAIIGWAFLISPIYPSIIMSTHLEGLRVAALATNGFEEVELISPREALEEAGATVDLVSPESGTIRSWDHTDWGKDYPVDRPLSEVSADDYDALLLPGGTINPDKLRIDDDALTFISGFFERDKPVAAICHAPWLLIEVGQVKGRRMTGYTSIIRDLMNAEADFVDEEAVVDGNVLTSRNPDDLPAFNREMIKLFSQVTVS